MTDKSTELESDFSLDMAFAMHVVPLGVYSAIELQIKVPSIFGNALVGFPQSLTKAESVSR